MPTVYPCVPGHEVVGRVTKVGSAVTKFKSGGEVRHLDEVKGNFGVLDGIYYRASATLKASSPPPLLISSTVRAFVEQQVYFFDMLLKKAIPAKQRIKEIEQGLEREFIETISDSDEIQKIAFNLVVNARGVLITVVFFQFPAILLIMLQVDLITVK